MLIGAGALCLAVFALIQMREPAGHVGASGWLLLGLCLVCVGAGAVLVAGELLFSG